MTRGIVSEGTAAQIAELTELAAHSRSRRPLYHLHADPARRWTEEEWSLYWHDLETEFNLESAAFAEAVHIKGGREHRNRVYSLVKQDGKCIRLDHDFARREKISRVAELRTGDKITVGRHNRAVLRALAKERPQAARALLAAGIAERPRPEAPAPKTRFQEARTAVSSAGVASDILALWRAADTGAAFRATMADLGLQLAEGDKGIVILDGSGGVHSLRRALSVGARAEGGNISAADLRSRLVGVSLPSLTEARRAARAVQRARAPRVENRTVTAKAAAPPGSAQDYLDLGRRRQKENIAAAEAAAQMAPCGEQKKHGASRDLRDRYARARVDHERTQADAKKSVRKHARDAHNKAYAAAWERYRAISSRFSSPEGIIQAIIAGIVLYKAEQAYLRDRRIADIDRMCTAARAAAPARPFPSPSEWLAQQAVAGDPGAVQAIKARGEKRERDIAEIAVHDPKAAAMAILDDAVALTDRVLSGRPRRPTDTIEINDRLLSDARAQVADALDRAQQSRTAALQQWRERGSILASLFGGRAAREYAVLDSIAKRDERDAKYLNLLLPSKLEDCRIAAEKISRENKAAVAKWEADPAVQAVTRERARLAGVRAAVQAGDQDATAAVLSKNLAAALAVATRLRHTPKVVKDDHEADILAETRGYQ